MIKIYCAIALLALSFSAISSQAVSLPGIPEFIDEMVAKHHFKRVELEKVFSRAQHLPNVIEAISRPATSRPWPEYRSNFVNPERIKLGLKYWNKFHQTLHRAEKKYGVPQEIILAVIGVETVYGQYPGSFRTLDALTTLAFDYPRRAEFFRSELENYLLLAREQELDLLATRGSYAGALGIPQFMPSSYRNFAVDFNGNKKIDLMREAKDAIGSVANYLKAYGWDSSKPVFGIPLASATANDPVSHEESSLTHPVAVKVLVNDTSGIGDTATTRPLVAWLAAGVVLPDFNVPKDEASRLIDFTVADGKEYWLVFNNFEVITRYNNSDYYAMSVFHLAEALKEARKISLAK